MNAALAIATPVLTSLCATLDRRAFAVALSRLKSLVARRTALPALEAVLIESVPGALRLTATDANLYVRLTVAATVVQGGSVLVPLRRLAEVARGPNARLQLSGDECSVAGVTHRLATLLPGSFPTVPPPPDGAALFTLLRPTLARLLRQTSYAMSADTTRPHLSALLIERRAGELRFVATDGHRLALARVGDDGPDFSVLVGRRTIEEVERMVGAFGGIVRLLHEDDRVWFVSGDEWVSGPVVNETFPRYQQVIPESFAGRVMLPVKELVDAVQAVAPKGTNGVTLAFDHDTAQVVLRVDDGDGTTAETRVEATLAGELPATIGINGQYLRELLGALSDDDASVTFELNGELDPVRVDSAVGATAVVMPMRI